MSVESLLQMLLNLVVGLFALFVAFLVGALQIVLDAVRSIASAV